MNRSQATCPRLATQVSSRRRKPTKLAGPFSRRATALLRAGYWTASGDVGAEARITWIEGCVKAAVYAQSFSFAILFVSYLSQCSTHILAYSEPRIICERDCSNIDSAAKAEPEAFHLD